MSDKLVLKDLPKHVQVQLKKDNKLSTRSQNLKKADIRDYAISVLNQVKGLSKSEIKRVLVLAEKMTKVK